MNNQNILKYRGTKLGAIVDNSELYDYELVNSLFETIDAVLDYSELYDYELAVPLFETIDAVLDISELYDYTLGDAKRDYVEYIPSLVDTHFIITEDNFIFATEDNYMIEYNG